MAYYPLRRSISALTNAINASVTFTEDHGYNVGQVLGFRVGVDYGMPEINQKQGKVLTVPSSTQVTVDIDTSTWGTFLVPVGSDEAAAACVPIASGIIEESGIFQPNINCSFDKRP